MKTIQFTSLFFGLFLSIYTMNAQTNCAPFSLSQDNLGVDSETFGVSLADFNGDGWQDVVTIDAYDDIEIYFNNGDGTFNPTALALGDDSWRFGVQVIDIENDGDWDFITSPFSISSGNGMEVWENDGTGSFTLKAGGVGGNASGYEFAVGDLNGDGYDDIFFPHGDVSILLNDGTGNFVSTGQTDLYFSSPEDAALGDFDNDNDLDAVIVRSGSSGFTGKVLFNDGTGHFTDSGQDLTYGCEGVDVGDVDADGDVDIVLVPFNGSVQIWLNDGLGNFLPGDSLTEASELYNAVILKDYNYDGLPDIFTDKQIWLNDTDNPGNFIMQDFEMSVSDHDFDVADINNDGAPDIYIGRFSSSNGDNVYLSDTPTYNDVTEEICFGDSVFLQNDWQTESGVYYDYAGCNELTRTTLTVFDEIDTEITENNGTLTVAEAGASYQWLDCNDGMNPIAGETSQSFTPSVSGSYAVQITQNGTCEATSECYNFTTNGVSENEAGQLTIYPNPATDVLYIPAIPDMNGITIRDLSGKIIIEVKNSHPSSIDISKLSPGIYMVNIQTGDTSIVRKILKK